MSTLNDVLSALTAANEAMLKVPELEATISKLTEDRDFIKLERDEAEKAIEHLKAQVHELNRMLLERDQTITDQRNVITDITLRNNMLSDSLTDMTSQADAANEVAAERLDTIGQLMKSNDRLNDELAAARTLTESLQNVLKGIGRSILSAVEVPEVTSEKPFPVSDTVGLSDQASPSVDGGNHNDALEPLVSPKEDALTAPGCHPFPFWNN